ncbi:hypothetical protein HF086_005801 [Spodoptera exigua]|uniref:Conserved oligomeric Golgi complex subunit 7 n=1 Tax=Spodoptera exigua TaxID=7107 RepID=A0A922M8B2_SPOEX|nr:hypothetical protein HF086_005801 [Spodoptera exigua]
MGCPWHQNAASALREADKWAALATSLEDILESGVPTQGDKLGELAEQVLSDAPDYETKRLQLETLYNRLEAAISPPLIEALTQMDADRTATYVSLFAGMGRTVSVDWLTNVLKSDTPLTELIRLYTDLLLSLDPSPTKIDKVKDCDIDISFDINFDIGIDFDFDIGFEIDIDIDFDIDVGIAIDIDVDTGFGIDIDFDIDIGFEIDIDFDIDVGIAFEIDIDFDFDIDIVF